MTTARCFGGVLDGTWHTLEGRKLMAPVTDYYIEADERLRCGMRVHEYTLQKFAVPRPGGWQWFHALIGPGFTVAMVKAWLDGWIEEADKLTKEARPGDKARAVVAMLERRIRNQMDYIDELLAERDDAVAGRRAAERAYAEDTERLVLERDEARERCNEVVSVARRFQRTLSPGGWIDRRVQRIIDAAFGR